MTTLAELRQANLKEQKKTDAADLKAGDLAAAINGASPSNSPQHSTQPQQPAAVEETDTAFLERVRSSLSSRTMHPIGSKVTTDMSPALFNRAKRFCASSFWTC